jgi:hypothetical protein
MSRKEQAKLAIEYGIEAAKCAAKAGQEYKLADDAFRATFREIGMAYLTDRENKAEHLKNARTNANNCMPHAASAAGNMARGLVYMLAAYYLARQVLAPKTEKSAYKAMPALQPA